jgi:L-threonylcarbamoyladenylate synthase
MPTETVYGLAANALSAEAVAKIFCAKERPQDNPLIVHTLDFAAIRPLVTQIPPLANQLAAAFWPGPLTLIFKRAACVPAIVSAGLDSVAVRIPAHPAARALLEQCGFPLAAPSANLSGKPSPTCAAHVLADLDGRIAAVLDGGICAVGVESTVLDLRGERPVLLRHGGVPLLALEAVAGRVVIPAALFGISREKNVPSPGLRYKHYAPNAQLLLLNGERTAFFSYVRQEACAGDGFLCFSDDAATQMREVFAALRTLDALELHRVFVHCPNESGAVADRLRRASGFNVREV